MRKFELFPVNIMQNYAELSLSDYFSSAEVGDVQVLYTILDWMSNMVSEMESEASEQLSCWTDDERDEFLSVAKERLEEIFSSWGEGSHIKIVNVGRLQLFYSKSRKTLVLGYTFPKLCISEVENKD